MSGLILTDDQQAAFEAFVDFLLDPEKTQLILSGYAGTGKSTLVTYLVTHLESVLKTASLLDNELEDWDFSLTATTNKAAEALSDIINLPVKTIQSFLKLRPKVDYATNTSRLITTHQTTNISNHIIFIDEASYVDEELFNHITAYTRGSKLVFIGDPAQLSPVKTSNTPVFNKSIPQAHLGQIVRQKENNPIIQLATIFRDTVTTGEWTSFELDGHHVQHLPREEFEQAALLEFDRKDWHHNDSKVLAWTNKCVSLYNSAIREHVKGMPDLQIDDYVVCNSYINRPNCKLKTDQMVRITNIFPDSDKGCPGYHVELDDSHSAFLPESLEARGEFLRKAKREEDWKLVEHIDCCWIDLRAAYACTINKSQGSTYNKVFIDLDDIGRCNMGNQIARMMYVAVSRARDQVFMTGDLV